MAGRATKTRNVTTPAPGPNGSGPSLDRHDEPAHVDATAVLENKAFRTEPLASLREDIGGIIKSEIRSVLEKEMVGLRADINMVRTELQSFQTTVAE